MANEQTDPQQSFNFGTVVLAAAEAIVGAETLTFEEFAEENGITTWRARWLMERLGYQSWPSFRAVINKAIASCMQAHCDVTQNFITTKILNGAREEEDFKLSRFACFLVVQYADGRKPGVEQLRTYLAGLAAAMIDLNMLERLQERETLTAGEIAMTAAATKAGVQSTDIAVFKNSGFLGMYNLGRRALQAHKGLAEGKVLYDHMGLTELAANSFRVTQTAERLKLHGSTTLREAQQIAKEIGKDVRETMLRNTGIAPEALPLEQDIKAVRSTIKATGQAMLKQDWKKPKSLPKSRR